MAAGYYFFSKQETVSELFSDLSSPLFSITGNLMSTTELKT